MTLEKLEIEYNRWGDSKGQYTAKIKYQGESGGVEALLNPEISQALLVVIGPMITKFSHQAALEIERNIIQSVEEAKHGKPLEIS